MREFIQFEKLNVEIWRRPRQRRMYLTVRDDGGVRVTCGLRHPRHAVLEFVGDNREFIAFRSRHARREILTGDEFLYFGRTVRLELVWTWGAGTRVTESGGRLELLAPVGCHEGDRALALHQFFRTEGTGYLLRRARDLAARTGLEPTRVVIRGQRTRWGSCTALKKISLNWKLVAAPENVIKYVILHELAHLREMNHSPRFWALVREMMPDYQDARVWLTRHARQIDVQFAQTGRPAR